MNQQVDDGSLATPRQRGMTERQYPFGNLPVPDNYSRTLNRPMVVRPRNFTRVTNRRTLWENFLLQSNTFNAGEWNAERVTPETIGQLAPNGLQSWFLREDNANDSHFIEQLAVAIVAGSVVRYLVAKPRQRSRIQLTMIGDVSVGVGFDLLTGENFPNTMGLDAPESAVIFPIEDSDGWWFLGMKQTFATGLQVQTLLDDGSGVNYPGDEVSGLYIATDHVLRTNKYGPIFETFGTPRGILAPDLDQGDAYTNPDPYTFLLEETNPNPDPVGRYVWARLFGRIPNQQSVPATMQIAKPEVPGTGALPRIIGDYFLRQTFIEGIWDCYFRVQVQSDSGVPEFFPTSGTYTITFAGDTTAGIAFDADAAAVETALNLLASITARGGVTVTGAFDDPDGFEITFADYADAIVDETGLTLGGSGVSIVKAVTPTNGGYRQEVTLLARQDEGSFAGNSSFTPSGANPMTVLIQSTSRVTIALGDSVTNLVAAASGDFTLTWFGDTTATIPWNASAGDIQTELNLLAGVTARGGATVTYAGLVNSVPTFSIALPDPEITGGDFTVELFGDTSGPIPWNASASDIQTELNLLAGVTARGGCVVALLPPDSGAPTSIKFSIVFTNPLTTGDLSGLAPAGSTFAPVTEDGGVNRVQSFAIISAGVRVLVIPGHPTNTGQECFIPIGDEQGWIVDGSRVTRLDDNTVSYTVLPSDADALHPTITEFDPLGKRGYKAGTASVPVTRITSFYLPGVTVGVNTVAEIPPVASQSDVPTFLQLAFSGTAEINYQAGEIVQWKGPIVSQTRTIVRAADL